MANVYIKTVQGGQATTLSTSDAFEIDTGTASKYIEADDLTAYIISKSPLTSGISGLEMVWNSATSISAGTGSCYTESGELIQVSSTVTASSLSLSSSTRYYVYLYNNSGTPTLDVSTTAPATAYSGKARSKTGDAARRLIFDFKTDSSGNVLQFQHNAALGYVSLMYAIPTVLNNGKATSYTAVSFLDYVSVTTRNIQITAVNSDASLSATMRTSDTSADILTLVATARQSLMFPVNSSQELQYKYGSTPTNGLFLALVGYYMSR